MKIKNDGEALVQGVAAGVAVGALLGAVLNDMVLGLGLGFSMCALIGALPQRRKPSGGCREN